MFEWHLFWIIFGVGAFLALATGGFRALMNPVFWGAMCLAALAIFKFTGFNDALTDRHDGNDVTGFYEAALALGALIGMAIQPTLDGIGLMRGSIIAAEAVEEDEYLPDIPGMTEIASIPTTRPAHGLPPLLEKEAVRAKTDIRT